MKSHTYDVVKCMTGLALTGVLAACLQTTPVVVTPQDQASRVVYNCPNAKTLDVTRVHSSNSVILVVDGSTLQLNRDTAYTAAERYTNRLQTLTLFGNSATYDTLGKASYGPCTLGAGSVGATDGVGESGGQQRRNRD